MDHEQGSVVSGLSHASSRTEHMGYLMGDLGLDRPTAMKLYRAERLQEKGQLKQASVYYQQVLEARPDCHEAAENARMVNEILAKQTTPGLPAISESHQVYQTKEMTVDWSDMESIDCGYDYYPDAEKAAFRSARSLLRKTGHGSSLLKLVKNETLEDVCNFETGWLTYISGRATFEVTLLRDRDLDPQSAYMDSTGASAVEKLAELISKLSEQTVVPAKVEVFEEKVEEMHDGGQVFPANAYSDLEQKFAEMSPLVDTVQSQTLPSDDTTRLTNGSSPASSIASHVSSVVA